MNVRLNDAKEQCNLLDYYDGDTAVQYELCEYDAPYEDELFDEYGVSYRKLPRIKRIANAEAAKERLFKNALYAEKNLRARLSHADKYPKSIIPKCESAKRLARNARKMGMNI